MRAGRLFAVMASGFLLHSCARNPGVAPDVDSTTTVVASASEQPVPGAPRASATASAPAAENAGAPEPLRLEVLAWQLRKAGLRSVSLAEPLHGSPFRILYGQHAGTTVMATAGRDHSSLIGGRTEVWRSDQAGVVVRVWADEEGRYVSVRDHGVTWLLSEMDDAASPDCLRGVIGLARALADAP